MDAADTAIRDLGTKATVSRTSVGDRLGLAPGERTAWSAYLALGLGLSLVSPALPALHAYLNVNYAELGLLFTAVAAGTGVSYLFSSALLDRTSYRVPIAGGALLLGLCLAGAIASRSLWVWIVAMGLGSVAGGAMDIASARLVSESAPARRNAALNLLNVFFGVGALAAPLLVALDLSAHRPVTWPFALSAVSLLTLAVGAWRQLGSRRARVTHAARLGQNLRWALRQRWLRPLMLVVGLYIGTEVGFAGWLASYAHSALRLSLAQAATLPFLFWTAVTGGRIVATERARRWREERLLALGAGLTATGVAMCLWVPTVPGLLVGTLLTGVGSGPIFPVAFALAARIEPERQSASFGILYPSGAVGNLLMPWLAGVLFSLRGPGAAMAVPLAGTLAMAAVTLGWLRPPFPGAGHSRTGWTDPP